jgi:hypothetical protein
MKQSEWFQAGTASALFTGMHLLVALSAILLGGIHEIAVLFVKPTLPNFVIGVAILVPGVAMLNWRERAWPTAMLAAASLAQVVVYRATFPVAMTAAALLDLTVQLLRRQRWIVGSFAAFGTIAFGALVVVVHLDQPFET